MAAGCTLFSLLGVDRTATPEQIEAAWQAVRFQHGAVVPPEVEDAYRILRDPDQRAGYATLLYACEKHLPTTVTSEAERNALIRICGRVGFKVYADRRKPNVFYIRWPEDPDPTVGPATVAMGVLPPTEWQKFCAALGAFLTLKPLWQEGKGLGERVVLGVIYVALGYGIIVGGSQVWDWSIARVQAAQARSRAAEARALEEAVRTKHATAADGLRALEDAQQELEARFRTELGAGPDDRQPPRELDLCVIRHESVRDAWSSIRAARIPAEKFASVRAALADVNERIRAGSFLEKDRALLEDTLRWERDSQAMLRVQGGNVSHIREMLDADRLADGNKAFERSQP